MTPTYIQSFFRDLLPWPETPTRLWQTFREVDDECIPIDSDEPIAWLRGEFSWDGESSEAVFDLRAASDEAAPSVVRLCCELGGASENRGGGDLLEFSGSGWRVTIKRNTGGGVSRVVTRVQPDCAVVLDDGRSVTTGFQR